MEASEGRMNLSWVGQVLTRTGEADGGGAPRGIRVH